jgi:hypothetical protein
MKIGSKVRGLVGLSLNMGCGRNVQRSTSNVQHAIKKNAAAYAAIGR